MAIGLKIEPEKIDRTVILRLDGRIDTTTSPALSQKIETLIEEGHHLIALDCEYVHYLSSAGMRVLLSKSRELHAKKGVFALFSVTIEVEEVLKMTGFDRILHIFPTETEALQFISQAG
ncbi:MAG TPA: STAS domain-containing protein [Chlamydiales bacterium]|nr:STAS domain-containing protein [Chlamydiales bacterium]